MNQASRGRRTSLGVQTGRLRGGFRSTPLPGMTRSNPLSPPNPAVHSSPRPVVQETIYAETAEDQVGAINSVVNTCKTIQQQVKGVELRIAGLEQRQSKILDAVQELSRMLKQQMRDSFSVKGSHIETPLRAAMANLFCGSLSRSPLDSDIQAAVVEVMGRPDAREKYKAELALKYCRARLTEMRTEERRKVLGQRPYNRTCFLPTKELAQQLMRQMHAPDETDEEQYIKHLAIFRKIVRHCNSESEVKYATFREWLDDSQEITEDMWTAVMEEDEGFDYETKGSGLALCVSEQVVTTELVDDPSFNSSLNSMEDDALGDIPAGSD